MVELHIKIRKRIARLAYGENFVSYNEGYKIIFDFDREWDSIGNKIARFIFGENYIDCPINGNEVEIPLIKNADTLEIGVYSDNLYTTTAVKFKVLKSIKDEEKIEILVPEAYPEIEELDDEDLIRVYDKSEEKIGISPLKKLFDKMGVAIDDALTQAKESGEFDGKSAYSYAVDGGYTGTEEEFAAKLAAEIPAPYTLPIASETTLGGVKPVSKTAEMTQSVGVDDAGALWAKAASGGGEELLYSYTVTEDNVAINSTSFAISPGIEAWKYTDITVRTYFLFGKGAEESAYIYAGGAMIFTAEYFRRAEGEKNSASFSIKCVGDSPENSAAFSYILGFFSGYSQQQIDRIYLTKSGTNGVNITDTTGCIKSIGFSSNNGFVLNSGSTVKIYGIRRGDV